MDLSQIINIYGDRLEQQYHHRLLPSHRRALDAMTACQKSCGEVHAHCQQCSHQQTYPLSCGHRSCPKCQNKDTTTWLNRQTQKLLPTPYFMATFTIPSELRGTAWRYQKIVYDAMFKAARETLKEFGLNPKHLGADIGFTGVLHTHSRRLDYHPHIHFIIPGGGIDTSDDKKKWRNVKNKYLFHGSALAKMFRGKMMYLLIDAEIPLPSTLPKEWIVDCDYVGKGQSVLKYLSRYLYRGVIAQDNIISDKNGKITFSYIESGTNIKKTRTLPGEDFLWLTLQHVLPRGFRRIRDYGFLHANAKRGLTLVQVILNVNLPSLIPVVKRGIICITCKIPMTIVQVTRRKIPMNIQFKGTKNKSGVT